MGSGDVTVAEREIVACANQVIGQYGRGAWLHASRRAADLLAAGDASGHRTWLLILQCIEVLEQMTPSGSLR